MTYEQAQAQMPEGWALWGNFGDGLWRAGREPQTNDIIPSASLEEALKLAKEAAKNIGS